MRSLFSTGIGELTFTIVAGSMAFFGVEPFGKAMLLMLNGYLFKMLYASIAVWPTVMLVNFLKRSEKVDAYDIGVNYNPFKLSVSQ